MSERGVAGGRSPAAGPRVGLFGAAAARPLDLVEAFLGHDLQAAGMHVVETGRARLTCVEADWRGRVVQLRVAVMPRADAVESFAEALAECDGVIFALAAGGWDEQRAAADAFVAALRRADRPRRVVLFVNEYLAPRLEAAPVPEDLRAALGACREIRGRACWWRHEKSGTDLMREAVDAAIGEPDAGA